MSVFAKQQELDLTKFVDNKLIFGNPQSGQIKKIKAGFSFPSFFFDWIALLVKGLTGRGLLMLGFYIAAFIINMFVNEHQYRSYQQYSETVLAVALFFLCVCLIMKIAIGSAANLWHGKDLIDKGWILLNADNEEVKRTFAIKKEWSSLPTPTEEQVKDFITASKMKSGVASVEDVVDLKIVANGIENIANINDTAKSFEPEPQYYAQAEQEIDDGTYDRGLWAKALVEANGKEELRKIEYMKLRAKQLQNC